MPQTTRMTVHIVPRYEDDYWPENSPAFAPCADIDHVDELAGSDGPPSAPLPLTAPQAVVNAVQQWVPRAAADNRLPPAPHRSQMAVDWRQKAYEDAGQIIVEAANQGLPCLDLRGTDPSCEGLRSLPDCFAAMPHLRELRVANLDLRSLPPSLQHAALTRLDCSYNHLPALPAWAGKMHALQQIDASHNVLRSVPASVMALPNLRELNLYENDIQDLPARPGPLLQRLSLANNPSLSGLPRAYHRTHLHIDIPSNRFIRSLLGQHQNPTALSFERS